MLNASKLFRTSLKKGRNLRYLRMDRLEIRPLIKAVLMPILWASTSQAGHISVSRQTRISGRIKANALSTAAGRSNGAKMQGVVVGSDLFVVANYGHVFTVENYAGNEAAFAGVQVDDTFVATEELFG